eukprot:2965768-Rhodomonas_salina.1
MLSLRKCAVISVADSRDGATGAALMPTVVVDEYVGYIKQEEELGGYEAAVRRMADTERFYSAAAKLLNCEADEVYALPYAYASAPRTELSAMALLIAFPRLLHALFYVSVLNLCDALMCRVKKKKQTRDVLSRDRRLRLWSPRLGGGTSPFTRFRSKRVTA